MRKTQMKITSWLTGFDIWRRTWCTSDTCTREKPFRALTCIEAVHLVFGLSALFVGTGVLLGSPSFFRQGWFYVAESTFGTMVMMGG